MSRWKLSKTQLYANQLWISTWKFPELLKRKNQGSHQALSNNVTQKENFYFEKTIILMTEVDFGEKVKVPLLWLKATIFYAACFSLPYIVKIRTSLIWNLQYLILMKIWTFKHLIQHGFLAKLAQWQLPEEIWPCF